LKYAVYGAVASGLMLFGMSLLFGLSGGLDYQSLGRSLASASGPASMLQSLAVLLFLGGLFFKIAAFPFHAWCPDAYEGAPTPFTAFVSVAPKAAGFAALARFAFTVLSAGGAAETSPPSGGVPWLAVLGAVSVATMTFGNLAAITQQSIKRMLAYSSIAHAGYMLMGVVALSQEGLSALIAYIVIYLIMNMGAFLAVIAGSEVSGGETFDDWQGMGKRAPLLAASMTVFMLSLTGIPPLAGFVGKFYLFAAVVSRGGAWYWVLAVAGVLNSVVSLYYYARVLKSMYLADRETGGRQDGPVPLGQNLLLCILAAVTLLLGLYWTPLAEFARMSAVF
jgi:NADH-quinone oxidoreductase subunit N